MWKGSGKGKVRQPMQLRDSQERREMAHTMPADRANLGFGFPHPHDKAVEIQLV